MTLRLVHRDTDDCSGVSTLTGVAYPRFCSEGVSSSVSESSRPECHQATHQAFTRAAPHGPEFAAVRCRARASSVVVGGGAYIVESLSAPVELGLRQDSSTSTVAHALLASSEELLRLLESFLPACRLGRSFCRFFVVLQMRQYRKHMTVTGT